MTLAELGLTPAQLAELEACDDALVEAWLAATSAAHGLRSPAGWFLSGVRSGNMPQSEPDRLRSLRVRQAERFVAAAGYVLESEAELVDYFFSRGGWLEPWAGDELLRARLTELWQRHRQHAYAGSGSAMRPA